MIHSTRVSFATFYHVLGHCEFGREVNASEPCSDKERYLGLFALYAGEAVECICVRMTSKHRCAITIARTMGVGGADRDSVGPLWSIYRHGNDSVYTFNGTDELWYDVIVVLATRWHTYLP